MEIKWMCRTFGDMLAVEPAFLTRRMEWRCVARRSYYALVKERKKDGGEKSDKRMKRKRRM